GGTTGTGRGRDQGWRLREGRPPGRRSSPPAWCRRRGLPVPGWRRIGRRGCRAARAGSHGRGWSRAWRSSPHHGCFGRVPGDGRPVPDAGAVGGVLGDAVVAAAKEVDLTPHPLLVALARADLDLHPHP